MTTERHLERDLPAILGDLAIGPYPDYIDDVLVTTAHRRQRPAWTFPERWLPMDLATTPVRGPAFPWRQLGVLAIIALLLAAALAVVVGSRPQLPEPFGPAANGLVAIATDGDIFVADPLTGEATAIVTGPEIDRDPVWSPLGTHLAFRRGGAGLLFVVGKDGSGLVQVTPEPLGGLQSWSFSPDGRSIMAIARIDKRVSIIMATADGASPPRVLAIDATVDDSAPTYRPPDGGEILFVGRETGQRNRGVYAVDAVTGNMRRIVAPSMDDIFAATWSPDGSRIAYGRFDPQADGISTRTHVVSADGTGDFLVDDRSDAIADGVPMVWSNDGTRLVITRVYDDGRTRSAIVPVDGNGVGIEIECPAQEVSNECAVDWTWAPDDGSLLGTVSVDNRTPQQLLADPLTGAIRPAPWTATSAPAWQRLAP